MSEYFVSPPLTPQSYLEFVVNSRFGNLEDGWKDRSANFISEEFLEALTQHGDGKAILALMPQDFVSGYVPEPIATETRFAMADEIGDNLWFLTDALARSGSTLERAVHEGLQAHGILVELPASFGDIQQAAIENAASIKYINKAGLMMGYSDTKEAPEHFVTSLHQNPLTILTRTNRRVTRSLEEGRRDIAPYASAADHEPISNLSLAIGEHVLTLAYVLKARLGVSLAGAAVFNRDKLVHRAKHGKQNDIHFDNNYARL